jgi:hypothetical protein
VNWVRATITGIVIVAIAFGLLVIVPDQFLKNLSGLDRHQRVAVATAWFFLALAGMMFGLRRLQRKHVV